MDLRRTGERNHENIHVHATSSHLVDLKDCCLGSQFAINQNWLIVSLFLEKVQVLTWAQVGRITIFFEQREILTGKLELVE